MVEIFANKINAKELLQISILISFSFHFISVMPCSYQLQIELIDIGNVCTRPHASTYRLIEEYILI